MASTGERERQHDAPIYDSKRFREKLCGGRLGLGRRLRGDAGEPDSREQPDIILIVADGPQYKDKLEKMKAKLKAFPKQTKDSWILEWGYEEAGRGG